ncbi:MAG: hypothetical protein IJB79_06235 [Candidatus Gastranaerophilales bacterium]|nr:hypothetical protein [Candidatus Gastranaerophilales bacterium]
MGKKILSLLFAMTLIILVLLLGYLFGYLNSRKIGDLELSRMIYNKAQFEYKSSDYSSAIKYLEVANDIHKDYAFSIDSVKKIRNLNSLIEKNPNDFKLYMDRADIKNTLPLEKDSNLPRSIASNYCEAVDDYSKALKINPSLNEIYHKRAKAYINCKKGINFKTEIIKDYEKAISFAKDKNELFEEVADWYLYDVDDAPSALRYYNKIENYDDNLEKLALNDELFAFSIDNLDYVPFKKIVCFEKIKDYEPILSLLDEIINETDNEAIFKKANNLKFYYDLRTQKFKKALNDADDCTALICKAITFLKFKKEV